MENQQPQWLEGQPLLGDAIRIVIIVAGFAVFGVCVKMAVRKFLQERRDTGKSLALIAIGLFAIVPSIGGLYRFNGPLNLISTLVYLTALAFAGAAATYRFTLHSPWWKHRRARCRHRR